MKLIKLLSCATVILTMAACDENNIGNSILDSDSYLIVDSTFTISGESVENTKIQSRSVSQLLGRLNNSEYGDLQSDIVTEFMPVSEIDTTGVSVNDIDSIKMHFLIPMGSYTGDSITPMRVSVYKLNKNLPYPIYSDFDPSQYYSKSDLLGSSTYTMTMLGQKDTLYTTSSSSSTKIYFRAVDIDLPLSLGRDFYNKYKTNPEIYRNAEEFAKYFPGVYATTTYGNGRVINIGGTQINLYYKKHSTTEEGNDTVIAKTGQYYGVSPQVISNNNIRLVPSKEIKSMISNGDVIVQAPAGYEAKVKLPTRKIVEKFNTLSKNGQTVLNSVSLSIPAESIKNDKNISVPTYLLFIKASEKDEFFKDFKLNDNITSFYAQYSSSTKSYTFSIREFVKQFLSGSEITDADEEFMIVPVDIEFETVSSGYYSTSSQQVVTSITPQISKPAMVKLNFAKARVVATFSNMQ